MGLTPVLMGLQGVGGILAGLGASARAKAAEEARARIISEIGSHLQQHFQQVQEGNLQALRRTTGLLGDSLRSEGSDMGAALANAGVSNSSATAGAVANSAAAGGATLGRLAAQNLSQEEQLNADREDRLSGYKLADADRNVAEAKAGAGAAWSGVGNLATAANMALQPKTTPTVNSALPMFGPPESSRSVPTNTTNPLGLNLGMGDQTQVNPTQSLAQTLAMRAGAGVGSPNASMFSNNSGIAMNGNANGTMFKPRRLY